CLNRFLTESTWEVSQVKSAYRIQVNPYIERNSFLLIDDTLSKRPFAKKVEKVNYHFDHTINDHSLGYSIMTSVIKTQENIIPYDIQTYFRKEDCKDIKFLTKNEIAANFISSTKYTENITIVIFDTWFSNYTVIGACKDAKKHYVTQIKSNRNVTINNKKRFVREHEKNIKRGDWTEIQYNDNQFRYFSTSAFISKIGSVHLIFSQIYNKKEEKWGETYYLISDMLNVNSEIVLRDYLVRVGIESFHREAKQNTGLEGYFLRKYRGIERYLFLVMLTYSLLVLQSISMKTEKTIGEMCEENKMYLYEEVYQEIKIHPEIRWAKFRRLAKARV
ncbi:MAG: transposase, partial [Candidatus Binatota bacterium]